MTFRGAAQKPAQKSTLAIVAASMSLFAACLDIWDTLLVIAGFVAVYIFQRSTYATRQSRREKHKKVDDCSHQGISHQQVGALTMHERIAKNKLKATCPAAAPPQGVPVLGPSLECTTWNDQVSEFLQQLTPGQETAALVSAVASAVKDALGDLLPTATVTGYCQGNPKTSKAFAKAVPEIEVVLQIDNDALHRFMGNRYAQTAPDTLRKVALRACTDQLASVGDFKFRRSTFKTGEPTVVLLPPDRLGKTPFGFSVNSKTPVHQASVVKVCEQDDPRSRQLVLLVQRWARDRGISQATKGHLPPYAWTLLAVSFLQNHYEGDQVLLAPFSDQISELGVSARQRCARVPGERQAHVGVLFKEFMKFVAFEFDFGSGIKDPFDAAGDLAKSLTDHGLARLREELGRAHSLCQENASVPQVFEPWAPLECASPSTEGHE